MEKNQSNVPSFHDINFHPYLITVLSSCAYKKPLKLIDTILMVIKETLFSWSSKYFYNGLFFWCFIKPVNKITI